MLLRPEPYRIDNRLVGARFDFTRATRPLSSLITFSRASSATYFDSAGVLQTAASGVARAHAFQDHDPVTLEPRGFLIEEQRTELVLHNTDISNAAFSKVRASTPGTTRTAPNGGNAQKLVEDSTAAVTHFARQDVAVTAGTTYCKYGFFYPAERVEVALSFDSDASAFAGGSVVFSLTGSGSVLSTTGTITTSGISKLANGWFFCYITAPATTTTTFVNRYYLASGGATAYNGDGTSGLFMWGTGCQAGAFPTSPILTTGSAATRLADSASITGAAFSSIWNQSAITVAWQSDTLTTTGNAFAVQASDNSYNNRIVCGQNSASALGSVIVSGGITLEPTVNPVRSSAARKYAFAAEANSAQLATAGTLSTQDSSGAMVSGLTRLDLGSDHTGANRLNGHLQSLTIYRKRLTPNSVLQTLTTP